MSGYRTGDALRFVDAEQPALGLMFDGRVAEDFKLRTGTWVHVGALRLKLLACADPLLQDVVLTGHDRDEVGALPFLNPATTAGLSPPELTKRLAGALARLAGESGGSSSLCVTRALVMTEHGAFGAAADAAHRMPALNARLRPCIRNGCTHVPRSASGQRGERGAAGD